MGVTTDANDTDVGAQSRVFKVGSFGCTGASTGTGDVTNSSSMETVIDTVEADAGTADRVARAELGNEPDTATGDDTGTAGRVAQVPIGRDPLAPETPDTATVVDTGTAGGPRAG